KAPVALEVAEYFGYADIFLVLSGEVERSVKAIADAVETKLNTRGVKTRRREGRESGNWVLLDFGDLIVHVFLESEREFYDLERLWHDAPVIDVSAFIEE